MLRAHLRTMQPCLLIVDDDAAVRDALAHALASEGYLPLTARHGEEAIAITTSMSVDLIILDISMPVLGGWDAFERLTHEHPETPVIILTGRPNQLFTSLAAGVGALLEKPVDLPLLLGAIRRLLEESVEDRLSRLTGDSNAFYYHPHPEGSPGPVARQVGDQPTE